MKTPSNHNKKEKGELINTHTGGMQNLSLQGQTFNNDAFYNI